MKLAFYRGPRKGIWIAVSRFVRFWTRGAYCHAELILSDGRTANCSISKHGVCFERKDYDPAHWDIVDIGEAGEASAIRWFEEHCGARFDTWGLLAFIWPRKDDESRWFCSEACAAALGFPEPWRFSPSVLHAVVTSRRFVRRPAR